ncbi:hypothetical protein GXW82_01505 [Streptacidiphilus sp. 4-A2]|nr:hypothetical protein [Streptacidiphilus sp. 4-A2]
MALATKQASAYTSMHVRMTEVVPKLGTVTCNGMFSYQPMAVDMTMDNPAFAQLVGSGSIHMMMADGVAYMDLGAAGAQELGGKHWLKMDFASLGTAGQSLSAMMNSSSGQSPATTVKLLASSGAVKRVGQQTVDGVQATFYSGVVNVKQLISKGVFGTSADAGLKQFLGQESNLGLSDETINLWVDSRNLPVRAQETGSSTAGPINVTIDYSDYSTPLQITPPPASDTVDYSALLHQAQGNS